jgi:glycosyltransferase involved in cell wall biosynthesis
VVEAMSVGLPVISTDCPFGPGEIITDGVNGFLVPVGDPAKLAEKVIDVIEHPNSVSELKVKAKERAMDFSSQKIASTYCFLLKDLSRKMNRLNDKIR